MINLMKECLSIVLYLVLADCFYFVTMILYNIILNYEYEPAVTKATRAIAVLSLALVFRLDFQKYKRKDPVCRKEK